MGQTQLLLVVLAVILVCVAILVGVNMFTANAVENTRNAIIVDLQGFSAKALAYYWKPATHGGGDRSFVGATIRRIAAMSENVNAYYYVESAQTDSCVLVGVGKIVSSNGDSIRVRYTISPTKRGVIEIVN